MSAGSISMGVMHLASEREVAVKGLQEKSYRTDKEFYKMNPKCGKRMTTRQMEARIKNLEITRSKLRSENLLLRENVMGRIARAVVGGEITIVFEVNGKKVVLKGGKK